MKVEKVGLTGRFTFNAFTIYVSITYENQASHMTEISDISSKVVQNVRNFLQDFTETVYFNRKIV